MYKISLITGDGIGPELSDSAISVLNTIQEKYGIEWTPWSAFTLNKTCNRNMSGLHVRAKGDVTACSESPAQDETDSYTFGNVLEDNFSLKDLAHSEKLAKYRLEFENGHGINVCSPDVCDLNANDLCRGGCATRSAYSLIDPNTGLITTNTNPLNYSQHREDPLCPAWTQLAMKQGVLREGLLRQVYDRIIDNSSRINHSDLRFEDVVKIH